MTEQRRAIKEISPGSGGGVEPGEGPSPGSDGIAEPSGAREVARLFTMTKLDAPANEGGQPGRCMPAMRPAHQ